MKYYNLGGGLDRSQLALLQEAGIDLSPLEGEKVTLHRLERGKVLHRQGCTTLYKRQVVAVRRSIVEVASESMHTSCSRWLGWTPAAERWARERLNVAEVVVATQQLLARNEPAFSRLLELQNEAHSDSSAELFRNVYGSSQRHDEVLKQLAELEERWEKVGKVQRAVACVAQSLALPRESVKLLGASHDKAGRLVQAAWEAWTEELGAEGSFAEAKEAALRALAEKSAAMRRRGEEVTEADLTGLGKLVGRWRKVLEKVTAAEEGEVLLAASGPYHLQGSNSPIARIAAAFPSAQSGHHTLVVRCPAQVADWAHSQMTAWHADSTEVLGVALPGDSEAVLETTVTLWDPQSSSDTKDARRALAAARDLVG